jgi:type VI secretion system protein ImpA
MGLDVGALVAALSDDAPSGPDLYGDPDRQAIEGAFDRSFGDDMAGEDETNWREVIDRILAQAEQTRDIWLPVYMMRAAARKGDLEQIVDGARFLAALLEERWDDVHPQLEELGFIGRKTPCESLASFPDFLMPLQKTPFIAHQRLGRYCGADFVRFADEGGAAENYGMFRALLEETPVADIEAIAANLVDLKDALKQVDVKLTDNADGDTGPNFAPTYQLLDQLVRAVRSFLPEPEPEVVEDGGESSPGTRGADGSGPSFSGGINNRRDVERALDSICAYYAKHEPGSPVPFALRRAKEWISLDFMAVLEDIAPGGIDEAAKILKSLRVATNSSASWDSGTGEASSDAGWSSSSSDDGWS